MAFTLDKIIFSPLLDPISITHTVGFGSSLSRVYSVQNTDVNEVKLKIKAPQGITVSPTFIQLAPNQKQNVMITADRTFFDSLPKGSNSFNISFEFEGQGDPIDPTTDVIVYELQLTSTPSLTLKVGQTSAITAQVMEKNLTQQTQNVAMNKVIAYQSSNAGVVSVGQLTGIATGVGPGNAEITVSSAGVGSARVLVGVYADPPAPLWWEKVEVNKTYSQRFWRGPYTTPIQPYPTRETRNGVVYDVYYVEVSEDRMNETTYYYDWRDVTNLVSGLTDSEKIAQGYVSSSTKPAAPTPVKVDTGVVRVVTNSRFEERIVPVIVSPSPTPFPSISPSPYAPMPTPPPTPSRYIAPCPESGSVESSLQLADGSFEICYWTNDPINGGCDVICKTTGPVFPSPTPTPYPSPSKPATPLTCWTYRIWFDQASIEVYPPPTITYTNCNGAVVTSDVSFNSSASNPQTICAYNILSTYRTNVGTATAGCSAPPPPPASPSPSPTPLPPQTITLGVFGGRGTINGKGTTFSTTVPWGSAISISCVPASGYEFDYATTVNSFGVGTGTYIYPDFMVYANGNLDEVRAYFKALPTSGPTGGTYAGDGKQLLF